MTRYEIKSLSIGGILDQTVAVVKDHFGVLLGIAAIVYVPYGLINGFIVTTMMPPQPTPPFKPEVMQEYSEAALRAGLILGPVSLLFALAGMLASGAMVWAVARTYLGESVSFDGAWIQGFRRGLPLIWTSILYSLAVVFGTVLCVVPGILFFFWFILYSQTVMLEGLSGSAALSRSKELMKGNVGKAFVLTLLVGVITAVIGLGALLIPQQFVRTAVQVSLQSIILMFSSAAITVFYFSCRCGHEDFDLMRLAGAVEAQDDDATPNRDAAF